MLSAGKLTLVHLTNGLYYVAYCSVLNNLENTLCYVSSSVFKSCCSTQLLLRSIDIQARIYFFYSTVHSGNVKLF